MYYVCDHPAEMQKYGLSPGVLRVCPLVALITIGLGVGACCFAMRAFFAGVSAWVITFSFVAGVCWCHCRSGDGNRGMRLDVQGDPRCPKGHELTDYTTRRIAWRTCKCGKCE